MEAKLLRDPLIAQACVLGDRRKHVSALIVPDFEQLAEAIKPEGVETKPYEALVEKPKVRALYQKLLRQLNRNLADYEAISAFRLIAFRFHRIATNSLRP